MTGKKWLVLVAGFREVIAAFLKTKLKPLRLIF
jgi:hypothetical protein